VKKTAGTSQKVKKRRKKKKLQQHSTKGKNREYGEESHIMTIEKIKTNTTQKANRNPGPPEKEARKGKKKRKQLCQPQKGKQPGNKKQLSRKQQNRGVRSPLGGGNQKRANCNIAIKNGGFLRNEKTLQQKLDGEIKAVDHQRKNKLSKEKKKRIFRKKRHGAKGKKKD